MTTSKNFNGLLTLLQDLGGDISHSATQAELFSGGMRALFRCVPFDVAVIVMIEKHLELYVCSRAGVQNQLGDRLAAKAREELNQEIPLAHSNSDFVVMSEDNDLPDGSKKGNALRHSIHCTLKQKGRPAGMLLVCRNKLPFTKADRHILEVFSTHVSMLLDNLRARQTISDLGDSDDLTGVRNKRFFRRQLQQEIERARVYNIPLSLLMVDIDDFKVINDTHGHVAGDAVLSELCGVIKDTIRAPDGVSRYGGDEFAVVLPHTDVPGALVAADRILQKVREITIPTDSGEIRLSVSIGIAQYEGDATPADLTTRADDRLYEAKRSGKNRVQS